MLLLESYNLLYNIEHDYESFDGIMMIQASVSLIKKLTLPDLAETEKKRSLAQVAEARRITRFDVVIAFVILADFVLTFLCRSFRGIGSSSAPFTLRSS